MEWAWQGMRAILDMPGADEELGEEMVKVFPAVVRLVEVLGEGKVWEGGKA